MRTRWPRQRSAPSRTLERTRRLRRALTTLGLAALLLIAARPLPLAAQAPSARVPTVAAAQAPVQIANPAPAPPPEQSPTTPPPPALMATGELSSARGQPATRAESDVLPAHIAARLPALTLDQSQISVYVRGVDNPIPRLAVNAETPRIPASVTKLVTSIAALDVIGPDYRWHTEVYVTGPAVAGHLAGDLIIKGFGDPYLTTEAYEGLIRTIRAKGIEHIDGDLIFDSSQLLPPEAERGDFDGAGQRSYNALPAALSLNRQATVVHIYNDEQSGRVGVYTEPPLSTVQIVNEAKVVAAPCRGRYHRLSVSVSDPADTVPPRPTEPPTLKVSGSFASECPEERIRRLILSPERQAAAAFDALWRELGGSIQGHVRLGQVPPNAALFHRAESQTLAEVLHAMNKYSDNLMARMLFLTIGIEREGPPGGVEKSRDALYTWLAEKGFAFPELVIDNGSGLSRKTRISAASLGELLTFAYQQPWMPELLASLPILGVDGTLARRMRKEPIEGHAHLKTGTVRNASCIAGYVLDGNGKRWVVVVLVNAPEGQTLQAWRGHALQHDLLRWVYDGAPLPASDDEVPDAGVH